MRDETRKSLAAAINRNCEENGSATPDFILAEFLTDCGDAWNKATKARDKWYAVHLEPGHAYFEKDSCCPDYGHAQPLPPVVAQAEERERGVRGAAITIGALLRRFGQDAVTLTASELAAAPHPRDVLCTHHEDGSMTIKIQTGEK